MHAHTYAVSYLPTRPFKGLVPMKLRIAWASSTVAEASSKQALVGAIDSIAGAV
jgi:hypothetical protein